MKRGLIRRGRSASKLGSNSGFTLIELLTVMTIIVVLTSLVITGVSYAQQKAGRSKADAQIHGLAVGLESYKIDNGDYPRGLPNSKTNDADNINPKDRKFWDPSSYKNASLVLYAALSGDSLLTG